MAIILHNTQIRAMKLIPDLKIQLFQTPNHFFYLILIYIVMPLLFLLIIYAHA